jgi:hypothetical protein
MKDHRESGVHSGARSGHPGADELLSIWSTIDDRSRRDLLIEARRIFQSASTHPQNAQNSEADHQ